VASMKIIDAAKYKAVNWKPYCHDYWNFRNSESSTLFSNVISLYSSGKL